DQAYRRCCRGRRPCSAGTAIWSGADGPPSGSALHAHAQPATPSAGSALSAPLTCSHHRSTNVPCPGSSMSYDIFQLAPFLSSLASCVPAERPWPQLGRGPLRSSGELTRRSAAATLIASGTPCTLQVLRRVRDVGVV